LFLAPIMHHFNWTIDDWTRLGAGTLVGHLMECAAQVTGGYFADPGFKSVPNLAYVGFPIAEVSADGTTVITKLSQRRRHHCNHQVGKHGRDGHYPNCQGTTAV